MERGKRVGILPTSTGIMLNRAQLNFIDDFLVELIQGKAAIFAGAGLSVPAGYVDWRNLLRPLARDLDLDIDLENDLIAFAQFHVTQSGNNRNRLHKELLNGLSAHAKATRNHELLAALPINTYWTTNYDKLLETTLHEAGKIADVKSSVPQLATTRPHSTVTVFKMHGDIDRPDEAIVTKDDYEKYGRTYEPFITALSGDLVKKTFLFLGFSFTDPNLEYILARIRQNFAQDQRQHFAIFRTRTKLPGETDASFAHHLARQRHVIEDLKRFNIKTILVDEYSEITDILSEIVNRQRRRTVLLSGSGHDFSPWNTFRATQFAEELGRRLIADGSRLATGIGLGVGNAAFTGALREVINQKIGIEEALVLRPFPQLGEVDELSKIWTTYREELCSHAGIALFLFGNKMKEENGVLKTVISDGVLEEFEIAYEQGQVVLPIGATGYAAKQLADTALADADLYLSNLDSDCRSQLRALAQPVEYLDELIDPIIALVRKVQGKS